MKIIPSHSLQKLKSRSFPVTQLITPLSGTVSLRLGNDRLVARELMSSRTISSKKLSNQLKLRNPLSAFFLKSRDKISLKG